MLESSSRFLDAGKQARLGGPGDELAALHSLAYGSTHLLDGLWRQLELDQALGN